MKLRDIMATEVYCASPSAKVAEVAQAMKRHNVGSIPICQNDRLVGIVTDRDIVLECVAAGLDPKEVEIRDFMTAEPLTGSPEMSLEAAAELMGKEQIRRLPVVENGRLVGMVSLGDLAINIADDKIVANLIRRVSQPVRSARPVFACLS